MPGTIAARGNILLNVTLQANLTPVAVAANSTVEQNFTVAGLISSDQISSMTFQGAFTVNVAPVNFRVATSNVLIVAFQNPTNGSVTPPSGNYYLEVNRPEALPAPANLV
jgi:hypothetical protein